MNSLSQIIVSFASLIVLVRCYPLQNYGHLLEDNSGGYGGGDDYQHKHEPATPYTFGYKVYDPKHGTDFGQNEHSDGNTVRGQYQVALPDGRLQQVTYTADWKNGYNANVQYLGGKSSEGLSNLGGLSGHGSGDFSGSQSYEISDHGGYTPSYSSSSEHLGGY